MADPEQPDETKLERTKPSSIDRAKRSEAERAVPEEEAGPDATVDQPRIPPGKQQPGMLVSERVRLDRPLGSGGMADVWVAEHLTLGTSVAVKFLRATHDESLRDRFTREAQLAARIDHPHAVRVFDHGVTSDGTPYMVMEYVEGESLAQRIRRMGALPPAEVGRLVDQVGQVLRDAHERGIIHRDIKPHNIMVLEREPLYCKVLDFGLAKTLTEDETLTQAGWVLGTPAYMAPEQLVDAKPPTKKSDAWGLSIVAYEALVGHRPFRGHHQAALGLGMLVQRFDPVSQARPGLPEALDEWFLKALAVDPDHRFPTVEALTRTFLAALEDASDQPRSRLGADGRIRIPNRLYGRATEIQTVSDAYARVAAGESRLVLFEGYAGVGKTALAEEARRLCAAQGAIFVDGKFDQFNRGAPYESLLQALGKLVRYIGTQSHSSLEGWQARLREALGEVGHVLTDLIPELEDIIGRQSELLETSPAEARNRFQNAVARLMRGVATAERPLVLFMDDLQWADLPTIDLLGSLALSPDEHPHVLVLGAYRSNEVKEGHPLDSCIAGLRQADAALDEVSLGPLGEDAVLELLTDALGSVPGRVRLAVLCHEKTQGNPFFLKRFLEALHEERLLEFDESRDAWTWQQSRIHSRPVGEDVVAFIAAEMGRLPESAREALALAACIGGQFDLGTLSHLMKIDRRRTLECLRPVLAADFILPASDEVFSATEDVGPRRVAFRFAHDRIQQAAHSLFSTDRAAEVHLAVAHFLLEHLDESEREARLFELVEHLNQSADIRPALVGDTPQLRSLNLTAARRATRSAAFEPAGAYYEKARALVDSEHWESDYEQALAIHVEGARAAYFNGDRERMNELVDAAVAHARTTLDAVEAREVKIHALIAEQRFDEAVSLALEVLGQLGIDLPRTPGPDDVGAVVGATIGALQATSAEKISALPDASDPTVVAAQRIKQGVMSAAYLTAPNLLPLLTCDIVQSTLRDGVARQSAYGFAVFGMVMNAAGLIDVSYENGKIAMALLERSPDRSMMAKTQHIVRAHLNPFVEPITEVVEHERAVFQLGMDTGDLEYAAWALHNIVAYGFYSGMPLEELRQVDERSRTILERHKQLPALACTKPYSQTITNLGGDGTVAQSTQLRGLHYDETEHMAELVSLGFRGAAYILTVARTFIRFVFRDIEGALRAADSGAEYADGAIATYHAVWWNQYRALSALGTLETAKEDDLLIVSAKANLAALEKWCAFSPINHTHRVALVQAELARALGQDTEAVGHYEVAIRHAAEAGFLHEEALANELAGRFFVSRDSRTQARAFLTEALDAYAEWGAAAKAEHLEIEFTEALRRRRRGS